jgi:DNA-dependent protein kinase catalytic subunit
VSAVVSDTMALTATHEKELSDLSALLHSLHACVGQGRSSGSKPKKMVADAFAICTSTRIEKNKALQASAVSRLFLSTDPPDMLSFIDENSRNFSKGASEFKDMHEACLTALSKFTEMFKKGVSLYRPYLSRFRDICYSMLRREARKEVQFAVFQPLFAILDSSPREHSNADLSRAPWLDAEQMGVAPLRQPESNRITRPFYDVCFYLNGKTAKAFGKVNGAVLEMLGRLLYTYHISLNELAEAIISALVIKLRSKEKKANIISGATSGLEWALHCLVGKSVGYEMSTLDKARVYKEIFVESMIVPDDLKRFKVPVTAMKFISVHAHVFAENIVKDSTRLFQRLLCCFLSNRPTIAKEVPDALRTVLRVFDSYIASDTLSDDEEPKKKAIFDDIVTQMREFLQSTDKRKREFATYMIGDIARAIQKYWESTQMKMIVQALLDRYSDVAIDEDRIFAIGSSQEALLSACASILGCLPVEELGTSMTDTLVKVLKNVLFYYPAVWVPRIHKVRRRFAGTLVSLLLSVQRSPAMFATVLDVIVATGVEFAMSRRNDEENKPLAGQYVVFFDQLLTESAIQGGLCKRGEAMDVDTELLGGGSTLTGTIYDRILEYILGVIPALDLLCLHTDDDALDGNTSGDQTMGSVAQDFMLCKSRDIPRTPRDIDRFLNLTLFFVGLHSRDRGCYNHIIAPAEKWIAPMTSQLTPISLDNPKMSGFYKMFRSIFPVCDRLQFFQCCGFNLASVDQDRQRIFLMLFDYIETVQIRSRQFQDELFVASANMILSVPAELMDLRIQTPVLVSALTTGHSYTPVAWVAMNALERWRRSLPSKKLAEYLPSILRKVDEYLSAVDGVSNNQERQASSEHIDEQGNAQTLQSFILQFLGRVGGQCHGIVGTANQETFAKGLRWSSEVQLSLNVQFDSQTQRRIGLDPFLPRIMDLAEMSTDSKTKISACELLHAVVLYMLPQKKQEEFCRIYEHVFPCVLRLATDTENITRNIFEPLVKQLVHWFSKSKGGDGSTAPQTVLWLDAIVKGASNGENATLKEVCTHALAEFLKWAIKQSRNLSSRRARSPVEIDSLMRRLFNMLKNPSVNQQIGAAMTLNLMYRDFRKEPSLIEKYAIDTLYHVLKALEVNAKNSSSLALNAGDTLCTAVKNFSRMICDKSCDGIKIEKYRGYIMKDLVEFTKWLFEQSSSVHATFRESATVLFCNLTDAKFSSASLWANEHAPPVVSTFEATVSTLEKGAGFRAGSTPDDWDPKSWLRALEGCVFAYGWAIRAGMVDPLTLFLNDDTVYQVSRHQKREASGKEKNQQKSCRPNVLTYIARAFRLAEGDVCVSGEMFTILFQFLNTLFCECGEHALSQMRDEIATAMIPALVIKGIFHPYKFVCKSTFAYAKLQEASAKLASTIVNAVSVLLSLILFSSCKPFHNLFAGNDAIERVTATTDPPSKQSFVRQSLCC